MKVKITLQDSIGANIWAKEENDMANKRPEERGGITVREVNSEILIFLDNNRSTRLDALREAAKILQREVIREETREQRRDYQERPNDGFPEF